MRKLFGTDGVRGVANKFPMTPELSLKLGKAIAFVCRKSHERSKIVIGKDTRISGYMFESAITSGITSMGVDALLLGPLPTPGISFMTVGMRADAGVVISASHNPYYDNGIKFFGKDGFKLSDESELEIEKLIENEDLLNLNTDYEHIGKAFKIADSTGRYIVFLKNMFPRELSLENIKIVVDCANGAGYRVAPRVFEELGATLIKIGIEPDGMNINDECGSVYTEKMCESVKKNGYDIGIALDGDGDRVILCDEKGNVVDGDKIMAICATRLKKENKLKNQTLVATVMSNFGLDVAMQKNGIKVVKTDVGDRYVVEEMRRGGYNLGGEQSGHIIFFDNTTTGDGIVTSLMVLKIMLEEKKPLSELSKVMEIFPQILINVEVIKKTQIQTLPALMEAIKKVENELIGKGRVLVRYSGTSNYIRIMVEGDNEEKIKEYALYIEDAVKKSGIC